jgi:hypothetical protein
MGTGETKKIALGVKNISSFLIIAYPRIHFPEKFPRLTYLSPSLTKTQALKTIFFKSGSY